MLPEGRGPQHFGGTDLGKGGVGGVGQEVKAQLPGGMGV